MTTHFFLDISSSPQIRRISIPKSFHAYVQTQFNTSFRSVQCDNGRKFDNNVSRSFFLQHGVLLQLSFLYTSQQNGKVEGMICKTNNVIHTLLVQAQMPASLWAKELSAANYLLNRRSCQPLNFRTLYEKLFRSPPSYAHLRVFGYLCYPNLFTSVPYKLAPHSAPCVFLRYPTNHKGYRCLELSSRRIITLRHVAFDETVFPP